MAFFKLGCNWGSGKPDFYDLLTKHSIIICADHKMKINDYVAITQGFNVIALAQIVEERQPCTHFDELKEDFVKYQINYEDWNLVAKARIWNLSQTDRFQYQLQKGICQIQDQATIEKIKSTIHSIMIRKQIQDSIKLLESNHNLILTGAPGTGKTYLAKQIAKEMECSDIGFVQFHPSYDYTDFVEGLRPIQDESGKVGFERKDGVFKEFCKNALSTIVVTKSNFDEVYSKFIEDITENGLTLKTPIYKKDFEVIINSNNNLFAVPKTKTATHMSITKEMMKDYMEKGKIYDWKSYVTAIAEYIKNNYDIQIEEQQNINKKYVFIIDEINRGEISKIFGELFFSIDPGYRGKKGKVRTQYANMQSVPNEFDEALGITDTNNYGHFYIPENVYIIGTMNDIDRSVESMDFAFRRRFAFKEVTAEDSQSMFDNEEVWKDKDGNLVKPDIVDLKNRMDKLNNAISQIDGLSSAYHIGGSYFLKLNNYDGNSDEKFKKLWDYHIEGLLREYLRGNPDIENLIPKLKAAYNNTNKDVSSENNG